VAGGHEHRQHRCRPARRGGIETRFAETADLRLSRTGQAGSMTVFRDRSDIIDVSGLAEDEEADAHFDRSVDRPLLLQADAVGGFLQCNLFLDLPTVVRTPNGEISKEISYAMLIEGCVVLVPSEEEIKRMRGTEDDPLGDGLG
jgi:hypothetical protein